jgi:hypothetical protein
VEQKEEKHQQPHFASSMAKACHDAYLICHRLVPDRVEFLGSTLETASTEVSAESEITPHGSLFTTYIFGREGV